MHPDLKVGLALAMLIVGFAGAMCFRHRPENEAAQHEEFDPIVELDDDLELLPVRTYRLERTHDETVEVADNAVVSDEEPPDEERITLDPIASDEESPAVVEVAPALSNSTEFDRNEAPVTYVVRPGDTLSEISARLLGSTQRYQEIFEANRNLLDSPDDLRPGMELTIPPQVRAVATNPEPEDQPSSELNDLAEPTPTTVERFTPNVPR